MLINACAQVAATGDKDVLAGFAESRCAYDTATGSRMTDAGSRISDCAADISAGWVQALDLMLHAMHGLKRCLIKQYSQLCNGSCCMISCALITMGSD